MSAYDVITLMSMGIAGILVIFLFQHFMIMFGVGVIAIGFHIFMVHLLGIEKVAPFMWKGMGAGMVYMISGTYFIYISRKNPKMFSVFSIKAPK